LLRHSETNVNKVQVGWCLTVLSTQKGYIVSCEN